VGSAGIKRRKKTRRANREPEAPMSAGDVQRLFGNFSWNAYSPAGALEREGFFLRQLNRYRGTRWRIPVFVVRLCIYAVLSAFAIGIGIAIGQALFR
jgi:hypothetical protein